MSYIRPKDVLSPRDKGVKVIEVLLDEGESTDEDDKFAAAKIEWDGKLCIGTRWNGTGRNPAGFPTSRGYPIWQVEHQELGTQLEALFRAKAKGEELDWVPPLTIEQHVSELTRKGFCVTLSTVPARQQCGDKIIITAVKDVAGATIDGMQLCALRGGEVWLGKLVPVPEFEDLLKVAGIFAPESVDNIVNQVRERGQLQREGLSLTDEQIDTLRLRRQRVNG